MKEGLTLEEIKSTMETSVGELKEKGLEHYGYFLGISYLASYNSICEIIQLKDTLNKIESSVTQIVELFTNKGSYNE